MRIEFKPFQFNSDTWGIQVWKDGKPGPYVQWCDRAAKRLCTSNGIQGPEGVTPVGWAGSKSQAEIGCEQLQHLYDIGEIA